MNWIYNVYKLIVRSVHWVQRPAGYPYTAVSVGPTLVEGGLNPADQFVDFNVLNSPQGGGEGLGGGRGAAVC